MKYNEILEIFSSCTGYVSLQYTRGVTAGKKSVRIPADLGWSIHTYLCGKTSQPWLVYGHFTNQLTLAGLWTLFGVVGPSVHIPADLGRSMDTFRLLAQYRMMVPGSSVRIPADPGWSMDTFGYDTLTS